MYAIGGHTNFGGAALADVWYAQVLPGGGLSSWLSTSPMPVAACEIWAATVGQEIFVYGGACGGPVFHRATVVSGGAITAWTAAVPMPTPYYQPCVIADAVGYLYSFGGSTTGGGGSPQQDVWVSQWNGSTQSAWALTSTIPFAPSEHGIGSDGSSVFVLGGNLSSSSVQSAAIGGGAVGSWSLAVLPTPRAGTAGLVAGGHLFVISGGSPTFSTAASTVHVAPVNGSSVGTFATTAPLPNPLTEHQALFAEGRAFVIGGQNAQATPMSSVYAATVGSGTLSSWAATSPLPNTLVEHAAAVVCVPGGTTTACHSLTVTRTATRTLSGSVTRTPTPTGTSTRTETPSITTTFSVSPTVTVSSTPTVRPGARAEWNVLEIPGGVTRIPVDAPPGASISAVVANSAGEIVRRLESATGNGATVFLVWDGRTDRGEFVSTNVYVVAIRIDRRQESFKLAVVRRR